MTHDTSTTAASTTTTGPVDSGAGAPAPRTCTSLSVVSLESHANLMGALTEREARLALPGPGLAVGDLTGDGMLDVVLARPGAPAVLFEGDGTGALRPSDRVLPQGDTVALGLLNDDPHLDIVLAGSGLDRVLLSTAAGTWAESLLPQAERHTTTVSVFDADGDGDLDLFAPRHNWPADMGALAEGEWPGDGHALLRNDGTGHFSVDAGSMGSVVDSLAFQGAPVDVDMDGDLDVYINNDFGPWTQPNATLQNDGRGEWSMRSGDGADLTMFAMGTSVADPSGDGWPDLFVSNIGNLVLLQSVGDGTFVEAAASYGLLDVHDQYHAASWGSRFLDLDGDRYDDLMVGYSVVPGAPGERETPETAGTGDSGIVRERLQNDIVLLFDPEKGQLVPAATAGHDVDAFQGSHGTRSLVAADLDADGRPELLKVGFSPDFGDLVLRTYRLQGGCGPGITLRMPIDAAHVGARVVAEVDGHRSTRWMLPSATYGASAAEVYVGLGTAAEVDRLLVYPLTGDMLDLSGTPAGTMVELAPAD